MPGPSGAALAYVSGLILIAGAMAGCGGAPGNADDAGDAAAGAVVITYSYEDSSVPPPFHRSYVLQVREDEAHLVVDSYGDVLADLTAPVPPAVWANLLGGLDRIAAEVAGITDDPQGCTGGTGFRLAVRGGTSGGDDLLTASASLCAGANAAVGEAVAEWIGPARDLFGTMAEIAPEGASPIR